MKWLIFLRNKNFHNLADMPNIDVIDGGRSLSIIIACVFIGLREIWRFMARKFFINTGAQAVVPPIHGITTTPVYMTAPDYLI